MSHIHYCDVGGHLWNCEGEAVRTEAGDELPSLCICACCQVPMEDGDHGLCDIELIPCPEHSKSRKLDNDKGGHVRAESMKNAKRKSKSSCRKANI